MTDDRRAPPAPADVADRRPDARRAAALGLDDELRRARLLATFDAIVAELAPAAHGACRALRVEGETLVVEADAPIVGQELLLHARRARRRRSAAAPGGAPTCVRCASRSGGAEASSRKAAAHRRMR